MSKYQRARGVYDRLPNPKEDELWKASHLWEFVIAEARKCAKRYGFEEITLPTFENTELFQRSAGSTSDIVTKEMYTFEDKGGRFITLRPECTAPTVRSYIENSLFQEDRQKFFYISNCFRHDRMQKGRYREFYQFGVEAFGSKSPLLDVEIIDLLLNFLNILGLKDLRLVINSIGELEAREKYGAALRAHLKPFFENLSEESKHRFEKNPLRILDSKDENDQRLLEGAPKISQFLDEESKKDFSTVLRGLDELGIRYTIDEKLVRGLDYYNKTVFEIIPKCNEGIRQNAIGAGGRYDSLVDTLGGPKTAAIGFSVGIERVIQALITDNAPLPPPKPITVLFIPLSEACELPLLKIIKQTRKLGIASDIYRKNYNIKKALKYASDIQAPFAAILGEEELQSEEIILKNLSERKEQTFHWSRFFEHLQPSTEDII
jgi:histidyl-tRNA synthetase